MQTSVEILELSEHAELILNPVRARLLEEFREPASAAEVARRLDLPRQRVGHHVRLLQQYDLLRPAGERRKGNFVEQLLQARARTYVIAPQALGNLGTNPEAIRDRFSSEYLAVTAAAMIADLAVLRRRADAEGLRVATLTLETQVRFASPGDQAAFAADLAQALAALTRKYHSPATAGGRTFRFAVGGHPTVQPIKDRIGDHDATTN